MNLVVPIMSFFAEQLKWLLMMLLVSAATSASLVSPAMAQEFVPIPASIATFNVPPLPQTTSDRLAKYANTRAASVAGWQGESLLIYTRFANATQLHRVAKPLGYRQQLTFLAEPLGGVYLPRGGATDTAILTWDEGGSEFDQLFMYNLKTGASRRISDGKSLYASLIWAPDRQSFVYVSTERNGRNRDLYHQDLNGKVTALLQQDEGYWFAVDWSADGKRVLVKNYISINESKFYELDIATKNLTPILGQGGSVSIMNAAYDGQGGVYFNSDQNSEFLRLKHLDLATGEIVTLTDNISWDVEGFGLSPDYDKLMFLVNEGGVSSLKVWSLPARKPITLPQLPAGIVVAASFSPDGNKIALTLNNATTPSDVFVIDMVQQDLTRWTHSELGGLNEERFVEPELISYESFDGLQVPAFVYRPKTPGPHPVVISIHGGPEGQYRPYFSTTVQSYVNEMNVAVIAPNVRGSRGYGKSYLKMDNGRLRENSVKDIGALLDWIDTQEDLNSERVGVVGGSYGGYMVLASMVKYGNRLKAAVDSVGISNFVTFLENTQAYRRDIRRAEYGDERDPDMRAFLQSISPLNHVEKMVTPVMISQGANDPRVPASESEQMRLALEAQGTPVWYVLGENEGHGFAKKENRDYDRALRFAFFENYLNAE